MKVKIISAMLIISLCMIFCTGCDNKKRENDNLQIVTSFYPIYIMAKNITNNVPNVEVNNMSDTNIGCIHEYTLKPQDLKKIESADIFIENGMEIENFNDKIINSLKNTKIIESAKNINGLIDEDNKEVNGHTWTSINNNISQVEVITEELIKIDNKNSEKYNKNKEIYIKKLEELKTKYNNQLSNLNGKKVILLNESFEYLLLDLKLDFTTIHTDHEESTLSADKIKNLIETMKKDNIEIIIIDKNDDEKNAKTLQNETNAKIFKLNSCMNGDANIDSYIQDMEENLTVFNQMLEIEK